jgi:hypothetical protein
MTSEQQPLLHIEGLSFAEQSHGESLAARIASITPLIGGRKLGYWGGE